MHTINAFFADHQAWALLVYFVAFFALGFVWRSWATYRSTGINPLVLPRNDTTLGYIGRAFKWVMALIFVTLLAYAQQWVPTTATLWLSPWWLRVLAWLGLLAAMACLLVAQKQMGNAWRIGIDTRNATKLVTHGMFRYSRNPIFLALRCAVAGLLILLPTAPVLALVLAAELLMQIQVRLEEEHLSKQHGSVYTQYCAQVRRWL
jgi:protein-S-isoprenylcysteine O-methyltransferase Ste14